MFFETALNLVWLSLGLMAFANTIRISRNQNASGTKRFRCFHVVGVALIIAALFPYISATDDILRIQNLASQQHGPRHGKPTPSDNLVRLYETLDSPLVAPVYKVAQTFIFVSFVYTPAATLLDRIAPSKMGRSPPVLVTA